MFQRWIQYLGQWNGYGDLFWKLVKSVHGLHGIDILYEHHPNKLRPLPEYDLKGL
jgi:hypothetical protein